MQERTRWLVLAGLLLLGGVVAWRLTAGSYKADIQKICNAEKSSGVDAKTDVKKVEAWAKDHLDTPEANTWFSELVAKRTVDRAKAMHDEAKRLHIDECPLAASYDTIQADGEYRQDINGLCSLTNLPDIEAADDAQRLHTMLEWIRVHAKSTRTKALGDAIAQADPKARADVLREAANGASAYQCGLVASLMKPQTHPHADEPVIELGTPQINGDLTLDKVVAAFVKERDATRKCYDAGLAKNAALAGRVMLKIGLTPAGKVTSVGAEKGTTLPDPDVVKCVLGVVKAMAFPPSTSVLVTMLLPLDFIPKTPSAPPPPQPPLQAPPFPPPLAPSPGAPSPAAPSGN